MSKKTTKKHFKLFKREVKKWIRIYGLKDWEIRITHGYEAIPNSRASISSDLTGRLARIGLSAEWDEEWDLSDEELKLCAFHEVSELLICPLLINARARYISPEELEEAGHYIVRTLENVLLPKY